MPYKVSAFVCYNISTIIFYNKIKYFYGLQIDFIEITIDIFNCCRLNMNEGISLLLCRHSNANVTIETIMIIAIVAGALKQC